MYIYEHISHTTISKCTSTHLLGPADDLDSVCAESSPILVASSLPFVTDLDAWRGLDPSTVEVAAIAIVGLLLDTVLKHGGNEGLGQRGLHLGQGLHEALDLGQVELDLVLVADDGGLGQTGGGFRIGVRSEQTGGVVELAATRGRR